MKDTYICLTLTGLTNTCVGKRQPIQFDQLVCIDLHFKRENMETNVESQCFNIITKSSHTYYVLRFLLSSLLEEEKKREDAKKKRACPLGRDSKKWNQE